ncbi:putative toxin-antitoxin system toxin component, PIN family [Micromonospora sp. HUAS LYJ1]|uniref:PIN domain-containing protein n=1 Tax=Micromonospora sp. HUAS LYJ1 TaxID=3061626 RepID=UPI0026710875|nr:PIN domain-containing protein [Micromonospora sp. HUAS LYJ1]WKU03971.1 PIN domain-containing protein [Micromonospora sp. HUAS LYJ1]
MPFSVLLDANVLVPNALRDTLLRVAEADFYRPLWSQDILAETRRTILRLRPGVDSDKLDNMFRSMNAAFSDAQVTGYEPLVEGMTNDAGDRHVLAAAVAGRADVIVTNNVKHFPQNAVAPLHIEVLRPDQFLCLQYDLAPIPVVEIIKRQSDDTGRVPGMPRLDVDELLECLSKGGAPRFVEHIRGHLAAARHRPRAPKALTPHMVEAKHTLDRSPTPERDDQHRPQS